MEGHCEAVKNYCGICAAKLDPIEDHYDILLKEHVFKSLYEDLPSDHPCKMCALCARKFELLRKKEKRKKSFVSLRDSFENPLPATLPSFQHLEDGCNYCPDEPMKTEHSVPVVVDVPEPNIVPDVRNSNFICPYCGRLLLSARSLRKRYQQLFFFPVLRSRNQSWWSQNYFGVLKLELLLDILALALCTPWFQSQNYIFYKYFGSTTGVVEPVQS